MATAKTASRGATKAAAKARALEKARVRRIELDKERDARDRRLEDAAADVLVLLEQRAEAHQLVERANSAIGKALRRMTEEDASAERIAALCDLDAGEVKRLMRTARPDPMRRARPDPSTPASDGEGVDAGAQAPASLAVVDDDASRRAE